MSVLRPGLLDGLGVALAGGGQTLELAGALEALGARTAHLDAGAADCEPGDWATQHGPLGGLVYDASRAFGAGGADGLLAALDGAWAAALELGTHLIADARPGKLALIAPARGAGAFAGAVADALENLGRTLSIEWARHGITTATIVPEPSVTLAQRSELIAYLLSPAGEYFSGCRWELAGVAQPRPGASAQGTMTATS